MRPAALPSVRPSRPGRRAMLRGTLGVAVLAATGCDVRLEDDAPQIPLVPTREPIPAEDALLWLLEDCRRLAARSGPDTALYVDQAAVLRSALFRAGVPIETVDDRPPVPGPGATGGGEPTSTAPGTMETTSTSDAPTTSDTATAEPSSSPATPGNPTTATADDLGAALRRVDDLARCGPGLFPLVMSLLSQRWAAVTAPGAVQDATTLPAWGDEADEDRDRLWRFPHLAAGFAEQTAAAVYGFEVVAAQTREETRDAALATLADLLRLRTEQHARAGGPLPGPVLGYSLPFAVDSPESARRLATHVLSGLVDGYGGLLPTVTGAAQEDSAHDVVRWLGTAAAHGASWSVPLQAFPGTSATG